MDKKQQQQLDDFFKEIKIWNPDGYLIKYIGLLLIGISMILWLIPYQLWKEKDDMLILLYMADIEYAALFFLVQSFYSYRENGVAKAIDQLLQYFPISRRQLCLYRVKKLAKVCVRLTGISMFFQTTFALAFMHTFSVGNLLLPLLLHFVVPVAVGMLDLLR